MNQNNALYREQKLDFQRNMWRTFIAGGIAGAASRTLTAPLDRLRTLLQAGSHSMVDVRSKSIFNGLRAIYADGGWRSFWRANGVNVLKIVPENAIKLLTFELLKSVVHAPQVDGARVSAELFVSGALAGVVSQAIVYPLETIKTRVACSSAREYRGAVQCAEMLWREGKWQPFYRGLAPSLLGIAPYAGLELACYSILRDAAIRTCSTDCEQNLPISLTLAIGAFSSVAAQAFTYPIALIRTRLQSQGVGGAPIVYSSARECLRVVSGNGTAVWRLYAGIVPSLMKTVPATCIGFVCYEETKAFLLKYI